MASEREQVREINIISRSHHSLGDFYLSVEDYIVVRVHAKDEESFLIT